MNIDKNIERLGFTLSNGNKPNQSDIDALNNVIEWVEKHRSDTIRNNQLFAKLYIYHLNEKIKYYSTDVSDFLPQKELSRILDMPLDNFYKSFTIRLNDDAKNAIVDITRNGVESKTVEGYPKHPTEFTDEENEIIKNNIANLTDEQKKQLTVDSWHLEDVTYKLDLMVNEALNKFS